MSAILQLAATKTGSQGRGDARTWKSVARDVSGGSHLIKSLFAHSNYQARIAAANAYGYGAFSEPSEAVSTSTLESPRRPSSAGEAPAAPAAAAPRAGAGVPATSAQPAASAARPAVPRPRDAATADRVRDAAPVGPEYS